MAIGYFFAPLLSSMRITSISSSNEIASVSPLCHSFFICAYPFSIAKGFILLPFSVIVYFLHQHGIRRYTENSLFEFILNSTLFLNGYSVISSMSISLYFRLHGPYTAIYTFPPSSLSIIPRTNSPRSATEFTGQQDVG